MSTIFHDSCRVVKTRKPHRCPGCKIVWPAGTEMHLVVASDMGQMFNPYWCNPCDNLASRDIDWECMPEGCVRDEDVHAWEAECIREYGRLPHRKGAAALAEEPSNAR